MVSVKLKSMFFDRARIVKAIGRANAAALSKIGAFIRQRAKSSIRKRKKPSAPGTPPSSHQGDLRRFIWFGLAPDKKSVVIGPAGFNQKFSVAGGLTGGAVPGILEKGGTLGIREKWNPFTRKWGPVGRRRRLAPGERIRIRRAHYEPRPFMGPAAEAERPKMPSKWANSIKGP